MITLANHTNVHSRSGVSTAAVRWARPLLATFRMCLFGEVDTDLLPAASVLASVVVILFVVVVLLNLLMPGPILQPLTHPSPFSG